MRVEPEDIVILVVVSVFPLLAIALIVDTVLNGACK